MMPNSTMRTTYNQMGWIGHIEMVPAEGYNSALLERKARALIMERHRVHPDDVGALGSFNLQKEYQKVQSLFIGIKVFIYKGDIMEHDPSAHDRKHAELQEGSIPRGAGRR